jgi:phosphoserine phosphatase
LEKILAPIIYAEALELFEEHLDAGRKIFLVSSSPLEIVAHLADYLGIDECIASRSRVDTDGRYTGELEFYCYGDAKGEAVRAVAEGAGIDLAGSYAYSDSITDLPMLEVVGHPVAVNPDRELRREAEARDWDVRDFRRPVRLRTRIVKTATHPRTQVAAGVVAAVAAAAIVAYLVVRSRVISRETREAA